MTVDLSKIDCAARAAMMDERRVLPLCGNRTERHRRIDGQRCRKDWASRPLTRRYCGSLICTTLVQTVSSTCGVRRSPRANIEAGHEGHMQIEPQRGIAAPLVEQLFSVGRLEEAAVDMGRAGYPGAHHQADLDVLGLVARGSSGRGLVKDMPAIVADMSTKVSTPPMPGWKSIHVHIGVPEPFPIAEWTIVNHVLYFLP
jgi:hypothetical protein